MLSELLARADRELAENQLDRCEQTCESALGQDPENPAASLLLAIVRFKMGRIEGAVALLQALSDGPLAGQASLWLSRCHRKAGRLAEAVQCAESAIAVSPSQAVLHHQLAVTLLELGQTTGALDSFGTACRLDPRSASSFAGQAACLLKLGRKAEAEGVLRSAPKSPKVLEMLFAILSDGVETTAAAECARALLTTGSPESHLMLSRALLADNDAKGAAEHLAAAERLGLNQPESLFGAGSVQMGLGRTADAIEYFRRSIEANPRQGWSYAALAFNRGLQGDEQTVERMRKLSADPALSASDRGHIHFGLGRITEDSEQYGEAMIHYDEGNRLLREGEPAFDREAYRAWMDRLLSLRSDPAAEDGEGPVPVFVVGMPRSGTTLLNQMMTMHSRLASVGEQGFWLKNASRPISELRAGYRELLAGRAGGRGYVVDKMPDNYAVLPLIRAAFPNAKIVHVSRDAADTGLSNYTTLNRLQLTWARRQEDIVFVYEQYRRVVADWIPGPSLIEIRYEHLIRDAEHEMTALLSFLGLEWDPSCSRPELNPEAVSTPSAWQARQPINDRSIGRAQRFRPYLGYLSRLLEP